MNVNDLLIAHGFTDLKAKNIYDDKIGAPGERKLLKGTMDAGWFGEVASNDFISGDALANMLGITAGTSQYSNEPWLKFAYEGDVYLIAKKTFRHSISWDQINAANAVYGDTKITIKGKSYEVMIPRGTGKDVQPNPKTMIAGYDGNANHKSMWNTLMLPIHAKAPSSWAYPNNVKSPTDNWGCSYSDNDLQTNSSAGNGSYTWCQETVGNNASYRLLRGFGGVSYSYCSYSGDTGSGVGWRPVLKIVG